MSERAYIDVRLKATRRLRELDHRVDGAVHVTLLWDAETGRVTVEVVDAARGEAFELEAPPAHARDVYAHPYAYAAAMGVIPTRIDAPAAREEPLRGEPAIALEPGPVCLAVDDEDRAKAFYTEVLGFHVVGEETVGRAGERRIELCPSHAPSAPSLVLVSWFDAIAPLSPQRVLVKTPTLDGVVEELRRRGAGVDIVDADEWGRYALVRDPDKNELVLVAEDE